MVQSCRERHQHPGGMRGHPRPRLSLPEPPKPPHSPHPGGSSPSGCSGAPRPRGSCLRGTTSEPARGVTTPLPQEGAALPPPATPCHPHLAQSSDGDGPTHSPWGSLTSPSTCPLSLIPLGHWRLLTLLELLLFCFPADAVDAGDRFDVALADGRGVQDGFGGAGQAHGQPGGAHEDPRHPCAGRAPVCPSVRPSHPPAASPRGDTPPLAGPAYLPGRGGRGRCRSGS